MSTHTETRTEAWSRRSAIAGKVDFTMMYVAHDAFNRDLERLAASAGAGRALSPEAIATWRLFSKQLHTHHAAEDSALWPRLAATVTDPGETRILEDMEREHAALDPLVDRIDTALAAGDTAVVIGAFETLSAGLAAHMVHEEAEALPLLERRLGQAGWDAFTKEIRSRQGGLKGAAEYLPWVLDGAQEPVRAKVLGLLPAPARILYRRVWAPRYRTSERLH